MEAREVLPEDILNKTDRIALHPNRVIEAFCFFSVLALSIASLILIIDVGQVRLLQCDLMTGIRPSALYIFYDNFDLSVPDLTSSLSIAVSWES